MDNSLSLFARAKALFHEHQSILSAIGLITGFTIDFFTLERVDFLVDNLLIILYLCFAGFAIVIINVYEAGRLRNVLFDNIYEFLPFLLQFAFGGLFSAFVIFYSKSASLFTSGAFILILATLLVGNEFLRKRYAKLAFQVGIYFVTLFSFSIYFLPVIAREMGVLMFLISGVLSLCLIALFISIISKLAPSRFLEGKVYLASTILGLYAAINILYFTNIIPPIPLSLKEGEVAHLVERQTDGDYRLLVEESSWFDKFKLTKLVRLAPGEPVYVFGSVFAPTHLSTSIVHDWQYWSEERGEWVSASRISFPIRGGRSEGYRGFSMKSNVAEGKWRVDIETERGQVIGRLVFDIEIAPGAVRLEEKII